MGSKLTKKKNISKNKSQHNSISNVDNCTYPPTTGEPVISLAKKDNKTGFCGFQNGSISILNFEKSRIKMSFTGHTKEVTKIVYLNQTNQLCTSSRDKSIKLWTHIDEGGVDEELRCTFSLENAHDLIVTGLDISLDECTLLSGSRDNTIKLWDLPRFVQKASSKISRNLVTCVKYSPHNSFIAATGEDKIVRILDAISLDNVLEFPKKQYIQTCCDVSSDEKYVISSSNGFNNNGCEVTVWDVRMKKILCELRSHKASVTCCVFMPSEWFRTSLIDPFKIATCGNDSALLMWDIMDILNPSVLTNHYVPGSGMMTSILPIDSQKMAVSTYNSGVVILEYNQQRGSLYHIGSI